MATHIQVRNRLPSSRISRKATGGKHIASARAYQYHSRPWKINFRANGNRRMLILLRGLVIF